MRKNQGPSSLDRTAKPYSSQRISTSGLSGNSAPSRRHRPDYSLLIIALLLSVVGLIVVYAISPGLAAAKNVSDNYFVVKQIIAIGLGLAAFTVFSFLPVKLLEKMKYLLVGLAGVGSLAVLLFGENINGASRWIQVGGLSFQIAELIKLAIIVWFCSFLVQKVKQNQINNAQTLKPILIAMAIVGGVVAVVQSDLGSAAVMMAIILAMILTAGIPMKRLIIIGAIVLLAAGLAISTSSYRRDRVQTFLNPTSDCQAEGYQSCQALIAVGSGGIFGLGLGNGVQAYGYLPEAANDSIFAIIAEKFGFIGAAMVLGLYALLFSRFKQIIERTKDQFSRLFVVGVLAWISTQAIINIGAMIGLLPLKGITLPFISYGGTSIVFVMAALGIVFQISRYTSFEPIRTQSLSKESNYDDRPMRRRNGRPHYAAPGRRI